MNTTITLSTGKRARVIYPFAICTSPLINIISGKRNRVASAQWFPTTKRVGAIAGQISEQEVSEITSHFIN